MNAPRVFHCIVGGWLLCFVTSVGLTSTVPVSEILRANPDGSGMEVVVSRDDGLARQTLTVSQPEGLFFGGWTPGEPYHPHQVVRSATVDGRSIDSVVGGSTGGLFVDPSADKFYYTQDTDGDCSGCGYTMRTDLDGSNGEFAAFGGEGLGPIAVHVPQTLMCVVSNHPFGEGIFCGQFNDATPPLISSALALDMAIDQGAAKIYWTEDHGVFRMNLDGTGVESLVTGLSGVSQLALDPGGNRMWWSMPDADKIQSATMDGADVQDAITGIDEPKGLDYLAETDKLYFVANPVPIDIGPPEEPVPATSRWGVIALLLVLLAISGTALMRFTARQGRTGAAP